MTGNLVVDRPAAQRVILHSIPRSQIVPDPSAVPPSVALRHSSGQKRVAHEISNDESGSDDTKYRPTKKHKGKCKLSGPPK